MKKTAKFESETKAVQPALQLVVPLAVMMRKDLHQFIMEQGMKALGLLLEAERTELCGAPAYARGQRGAQRAGTSPSTLVMGGQRVKMKRPRVRDDGAEQTLPSWEAFSQQDPLDERVLEQMIVGVATRKYARSLEPLPEQIRGGGTSKSSVSRRFVGATKKQLDEWLHRRLDELRLRAIFIDGLHVDEHVVLMAMGVDEAANKHILGLWEGATENAATCKALLRNLLERGLDAQGPYLFIIEGSKALSKAIRHMFAGHCLIQRCQEHKKRNVRGHLPKHLHASVMKAMNDAYGCKSVATAKAQLTALANRLEDDHPSAALSIREGLDETLTVKAMGLGQALERTLSTTNPIENLNGRVVATSQRVKRWRNAKMILRWCAGALTEAEKGFRRLRGYKSMPLLIAALNQIKPTVDHEQQAA